MAASGRLNVATILLPSMELFKRLKVREGEGMYDLSLWRGAYSESSKLV